MCGRDNARGLGLRFARHDDLEVRATCVLDSGYIGFATRAHGGVVASLLDEAMGWATVLAAGVFTYTAELEVRYRKPVPVGEPLEVRGRVVRHTRRLTFAAGEVLDGAGEVLASATGKFAAMPEAESRAVTESLLFEAGDWRPG